MSYDAATERLVELRGAPVVDSAGEKIGAVEEIYVEERTGRPEWIGLGTGFFGTKRVLVPYDGADVAGDEVRVRYAKDQVKDSPDVDEDELSLEREQELYAYYGLPYGGADLSDRDADRQVDVETADQELVRHEEELRVGKRTEEAGRLRLHKWVETEQVDVPVELRREKARVVREPVDGTADPDAFEEDALEVTLSEERAVVEKEAVAKERIGIEREVETEQEVVSDEVRRERVDVDER